MARSRLIRIATLSVHPETEMGNKWCEVSQYSEIGILSRNTILERYRVEHEDTRNLPHIHPAISNTVLPLSMI